ncbi:MAG TPA: acyltransferase [Azospirillum sp.]|nr:acyltransferase [Azospirillum sp.]
MRIATLDSLRGIAALIVLLHHTYTTLPESLLSALKPYMGVTPLRLVADGRPAVILFFVLSGFVLTLPFLNGRHLGYRRFLLQRVCRVYLPLAAAVLLAAALCLMLDPGPLDGVNGWIESWSWSREVTLELVAAHLLMTGQGEAAVLDGPLWSLVYQLRISALLPLLILWGRLGPRWALVLALALYGLVGVGLKEAGVGTHPLFAETPWQAVLVTLHFVPFFLFGVVLALHGETFVAVLGWLTLPGRVVLWLVAGHALTMGDDLASAGGSTLLIALSLASPTAQRILSLPVLEWLGQVSYSLYLTHLLVLLTLLHLLHGVLPLVVILAAAVPASLVVADLFYRRVEVPAIALGRRLAHPRSTYAQGSMAGE